MGKTRGALFVKTRTAPDRHASYPCMSAANGFVERLFDAPTTYSSSRLPRLDHMKCDLCDKPAVVHEVVIKGDVKKEVHLCEVHAGQHGFVVPLQQPLNQLLTKFVITQTQQQQEQSRRPVAACPQCGLTFAQFRQTGTLGCAACYDAFAENLSPIVERAQAGATHHVGKSPTRAGQSIDRQVLRQRLVKELQEALVTEQYERAARLRDRLRDIETGEGA